MPNMLKVVTLCSTYVYRVLQCLDVGGVQWWCVERVLLLSSDLSIQTLNFVFGSNQNGLNTIQVTNFPIFVFLKLFNFPDNDGFGNFLKVLRYNEIFIFTKKSSNYWHFQLLSSVSFISDQILKLYKWRNCYKWL